MGRTIDTAEAAARLGVKPATVYAYVSRGLLGRQMHPDGKRSLFDVDEVAALRARSRRKVRGELGTVITSGISHVNDGALRIAGRDLERCVKDGIVRTVGRLLGAEAHLRTSDELRKQLARVGAALPPHATLMDRLRASVVAARAADPLRYDEGCGDALLGAMIDGLPVLGPRRTRRPVDRLWCRLSGRRGAAPERAALEAIWVALADHGLAASTFAVRVAASTRADLYSCVLCGLGALGGSLHGASSRAVHELFDAAQGSSPREAVGAACERGLMPGVGHSVYRTRDPRESVVDKRLRAAYGASARWKTVRQVRAAMTERTERLINIDFALGALTWLSGMDPEAGEAIFAIARAAGWCAHVREERHEAPLRFRPQARYAG